MSVQQPRTVTYGRHNVLQTISVTPMARQDGYWVIYIHGGAWRDPLVTSGAFDATESLLRKTPDLPIAGYASISYRLSAHPNHPQDPQSTPSAEFRDAKHPDHISDVEAALTFLQTTYGFGSRYILVGHSCGATLAFQTVMGAVAGHREQSFTAGAYDPSTGAETVFSSLGSLPPRLTAHPTAIVGVAGIYDLRKLRDTHREISAYREFIEGAFGKDEKLWDAVSPAQMVGSHGVEGGWKLGTLAVLAHSRDDELVDEAQMDSMRAALRGWEEADAQVSVEGRAFQRRRVCSLPLRGAHDEIWGNGEELARAIIFAFRELQDMGLASQ
ncbi:hypothetical protein N7510_004333 [Penicillium lagena]|uniref:uncharacterized protein n=1 Tax=Penicillium lagena TaxID=94218 RepID=UPI00254225E1|nr:uncharacterized protein N7510_004333 [Penicillium lagena]KAJ5620349.1 hypothetical protein N7510_004333 [Penicillium lagena]